MNPPPPLTLERLDGADEAGFVALLDGLYEHSPWVAARAWARRPADGWGRPARLLRALAQAVADASRDERLALLRAHPELAGKAMVAGTLTHASTTEQARAGLAACTPEEFERLQALNRDYRARFGWPFLLAVRGPRGTGLTRRQIIAAFERRVQAAPEAEFDECLRQVNRIAQIRLDERLGTAPRLGEQVWDRAAALARHTESGDPQVLTVTYLSPAHRACAADLQQWMRDSGFDEVGLDAVGNVVGRYGPQPGAADRWLLTGSHYDTVRDAGPHDGRIGILVPLAVVGELSRAGRRLPFGIEVVAFAEEEGQRFRATFLGSGALAGRFDPDWLDLTDAGGTRLRDAMRDAGLPGEMRAIQALRRDPARYLGFVEVHIEQGPVLNEAQLPLGIVTSINGSARLRGEARGQASHAGTTPMDRRHDAAAAVAELLLAAEARAARDPGSVATVGVLEVPGGSVNVVPGACRFTLDVRAPSDARRDALLADLRASLAAIAARRGVSIALETTMTAAAAPSDPHLQALWEAAVAACGLPAVRLASGAGHDAMMLHACLPQAMLFVRGENGGISHNPLESTTSHDLQLACEAFSHLLDELASAPAGTESPA